MLVLAVLTLSLTAAPTPDEPHRGWKTAGAAATGVASAGSVVGLGALLFLQNRSLMREKAWDVLEEEYEYDSSSCPAPIVCESYPRANIRTAAFSWSLLPTIAAGSLGGLSGVLSADLHPLETWRAQETASTTGGILLGLGGAAWLAGRLIKVSNRCYEDLPRTNASERRDLPCLDRWFTANASLMIGGASLMAGGAFALAMGNRSRRRVRVTPTLSVSKDGGMLTLSGRF